MKGFHQHIDKGKEGGGGHGRHRRGIDAIYDLQGEEIDGGGFVDTVDENTRHGSQAIGLNAITEGGWMCEDFMGLCRISFGG